MLGEGTFASGAAEGELEELELEELELGLGEFCCDGSRLKRRCPFFFDADP